MGGHGKEDEPIEWTGWALRREDVLQEKPEYRSLIARTSPGNRAEVIGP